mmetsp:Transcript_29657/g.74480  ORF Transcript_29657/g.74480 Transcript_29657/m.74480 type:complete len:205 (+) Transcript_29657:993-1607(+)
MGGMDQSAVLKNSKPMDSPSDVCVSWDPFWNQTSPVATPIPKVSTHLKTVIESARPRRSSYWKSTQTCFQIGTCTRLTASCLPKRHPGKGVASCNTLFMLLNQNLGLVPIDDEAASTFECDGDVKCCKNRGLEPLLGLDFALCMLASFLLALLPVHVPSLSILHANAPWKINRESHSTTGVPTTTGSPMYSQKHSRDAGSAKTG